MTYLLINHVPLGHTEHAGEYRIGDLWLEDLRAQARAVREAGFDKLVVATPCVPVSQQLSASGSFNFVKINPAQYGFEYVPLPRYLSMRGYLRVKKRLQARLADAIGKADVVQMGYGGHPVALGQVAWPIAKKLGRKRIWVFDGADPFPRLELQARQAGLLKRWVKTRAVKKFAKFCREAVRSADAVFAHNASVVQRFKDVWGAHCHAFDRSFVTDEILIDTDHLARRQGKLLDGTKPLRLIAAGRQVMIKGTNHVIRAVAKARRLATNVEFDVLGDGDDLQTFKDLAHHEHVEQHVRFLGTVPYGPELWQKWDEADVMVITNLTAEISRNVLLAAARGLPIITYTNAGTDDMLNSADAAIQVPRGDVDRLADAFIDAHRNRKRLAQLAMNGWKLARSKNLDETHRQRATRAAELVGLKSTIGSPQSAAGGRLSPETGDVAHRN
jgi:glycosyltransferase involved in cell wall biosynthesis